MPTLADLKNKWFIPMSGDVLGVPCHRANEGGSGTQLSVSTDGNTVTLFIDGEAYMQRWRNAMLALAAFPDKEAYHASWRLNDVHTLGGTTATTALVDLQNARTAGADVYVLLSMHLFRQDNEDSVTTLRAGGLSAACMDNRFPATGSNHQKMAVFKTTTGDLAILGSIDINRQRWDRTAHAHTDPARPEAPTHDTGVQVSGPAVADLDLSYRERWNDSTRTIGMRPILPAQPLISTRIASGPATGTHSVQVTRTYGLTNRAFGYSWYARGEFTTWASYLNAIRRATGYIYIEDQYFLPWDYPPRFSRPATAAAGRDVDVVYQLGEAMKRGVNVAVVVPRVSEDPGIGAMQQFQRNLGVNYLRNIRAVGSPGDIVVGSIHNGTSDIYVHSKLLLVDDEFTSIGSTNVGARSMTHDGEINVGIVDGAETFTRELRKTLWAEHTGQPMANFHDPVAGYAVFKAEAALGTGRLRTYVADPTHVWPLPVGTSAPRGHERALRGVIDPYAGPAALA